MKDLNYLTDHALIYIYILYIYIHIYIYIYIYILIYQHNPRVLCTFVPDNSLDQLLNISPTNPIYAERFPSEFFHIEVWFAGQNSMQIKIEERVNVTLVVSDKSI